MSEAINSNSEIQFYYERTVCDAVGDYLSRIASAIVSVFKRIFYIQDPLSVQDLMWADQKCKQLKMENHFLKKNVQILENTLSLRKNYSLIDTIVIEGMLFLMFMPFYIMSLPITMFRHVMYSSVERRYIQQL